MYVCNYVQYKVSTNKYMYCTAHDGWNVNLPSKPFCDRLPELVQVIKTGGRRVFVVKISHFYMKNKGNL